MVDYSNLPEMAGNLDDTAERVEVLAGEEIKGGPGEGGTAPQRPTLRADSYRAAVRFIPDRPTCSCSGSGRGRSTI